MDGTYGSGVIFYCLMMDLGFENLDVLDDIVDGLADIIKLNPEFCLI